jgi:hypothetical protein
MHGEGGFVGSRFCRQHLFLPRKYEETCAFALAMMRNLMQKLAGHASPVTTAKYDQRGEEAKRKAVQKLGF